MRTMQQWTKLEHDIFNLVQEVEKLGAHTLLTKTVIYLSDARQALSDWESLSTTYWQAELVGRDGNLTGLTYSNDHCLCTVGTEGRKFESQQDCVDWINKHKDDFREFIKATEHLDMD